MLIWRLYSNQFTRVNDSNQFPIKHEVKQGYILSPMLFNAFIKVVLLRWKQRVIYSEWLVDVHLRRLQAISFADVEVLYSRSRDEAREMLSRFLNKIASMHMQVHMKKTTILTSVISRIHHDRMTFANIGDDFVEIMRS